MIRRYTNACQNSSVLLEDCPSGEEHREIVDLSEEDFRVLASLVQLESYRVSKCLGALYRAGRNSRITQA